MIVEDEIPIAEAVAFSLRKEGYKVLTAATGEDGLSLAQAKRPDLVILDLMLPGMSGYEICRQLREKSDLPILMLTARASEIDKVRGLDMGADDYVVKPFGMRELIARVRSVLRRKPAEHEIQGLFQVDGLCIDTGRHEATLNGKPLSLTPKEFGMLALLASHPGQVFARSTLLDRVWGVDAFVEEHTVNVHMRWLRMKVEEDPNHPKRLLTVRGIGYKLAEGE